MRLKDRKGSNSIYIILEGIAFTVVLNLYNPFIQMFAKRMGAKDIHIALLNAIPPLVAIFVLIPFSILIERQNRKKRTTMLLILVIAFFYAAIAFVPFIPHQEKVVVFVLLIGLMNWPGSLYNTTWQSFFADNFGGADANRVYSLRSKYGALFGLVTVLATGLILTELPRSDSERMVVYQLFYAACFAISLLQIYFLSRVREKRPEPFHGDPGESGVSRRPAMTFGWAELKEMAGNRSFMVLCLCAFLFHISWQMGWPLFFLYNANHAMLNELQLGMVNVVIGLTSFLSFSVWNRLIEKRGNKLVIMLSALGLAINPFFFTKLFGFYYIMGVNIMAGAAGAGFALSLFCSLLETLPEERKTVYISVFNTLINISGFVSPLVGILIHGRLGIFSAFFIIGILRLAASSSFVIRWWTGVRKDRRLGTGKTRGLDGTTSLKS